MRSAYEPEDVEMRDVEDEEEDEEEVALDLDPEEGLSLLLHFLIMLDLISS